MAEELIPKPDEDGKDMHMLLMCMHRYKPMTGITAEQRCDMK